MKHAAARNRAAAALAGAALTAAATGQASASEITPRVLIDDADISGNATIVLESEEGITLDLSLRQYGGFFQDLGVKVRRANRQYRFTSVEETQDGFRGTNTTLSFPSASEVIDAAAPFDGLGSGRPPDLVLRDEPRQDYAILNAGSPVNSSFATATLYITYFEPGDFSRDYGRDVLLDGHFAGVVFEFDNDWYYIALNLIGTYEFDPVIEKELLVGLELGEGSRFGLVPEPTSMSAIGVMGLAMLRRRRRESPLDFAGLRATSTRVLERRGRV